MRICLSTSNTLRYPQGGVLWVFINWALGLRDLGHDVIWFDIADADAPPETTAVQVMALRERLAPYALDGALVIAARDGSELPAASTPGCRPLADARAADLLLDFRYDLAPAFIASFPRSIFMDIDPGILQLNIAKGYMPMPTHGVSATIGETVGEKSARFPDLGKTWLHTRPVVHLPSWPVTTAPTLPFTTVSHWYMDDWIVEMDGSYYKNDKRSGFLPFLDLPARVKTPLELAICLAGEQAELDMLTARGWRVRESHEVTPTAERFRRYLLDESAGEFGCAKPAYVKYDTAWISDRTPCYLAAGKPAVVQHTGDSAFLPDGEGLFRFKTLDQAAHAFATLERDYDNQSRIARQLAQSLFDSRVVITRLLEQAI